MFIVLIGAHTKYLYKFVRWEIEYAIENDIPIIAVNLNDHKKLDCNLCPPILRNTLAIHIPFKQKIIDYALNHWEDEYKNYKQNNQTIALCYPESIYQSLGI